MLASKVFMNNAKVAASRSFATVVCYTDMGNSKHEFVSFVSAAAADPTSPQGSELYKYLMKCFIDADTDYDGLVGEKGFNNMVHEAALAPRRFGFAPHTREMYSSLEEFESARSTLYNELAGNVGGITFESWYSWSVKHIVGKNTSLVSHSDNRWERSAEDFVSFYKGVAKEGSSLNAKSSSSTQYKEFYILSNQQFVECDVNNEGTLGETGFTQLVGMCANNTDRFGYNWYAGVNFSDVAVDGRVSWKNWFSYKLNLVCEKAKSL